MPFGKSLRGLSGKRLSREESALSTAQRQREAEEERVKTLKLREEYEGLREERKRLEKQERDKYSKLKKAERILSKGAKATGKGIFWGMKETYKLYEKGKKSKRKSKKFKY